MTMTWPRLMRWMLLVAMLGVLTGIALSADENEGCDIENPTEVCVIVYFPPDGWCHWLEPYTPLWDFLNCRQVMQLESAGIVAVGDQEIESAPFGGYRLITVRRHYSDGITREFYRLVPRKDRR